MTNSTTTTLCLRHCCPAPPSKDATKTSTTVVVVVVATEQPASKRRWVVSKWARRAEWVNREKLLMDWGRGSMVGKRPPLLLRLTEWRRCWCCPMPWRRQRRRRCCCPVAGSRRIASGNGSRPLVAGMRIFP